MPDRLSFAVNTPVAKRWWVRLGLLFVEFLPMAPANPLSVKALIRHLRDTRKAVIFPEGRFSVSGF